ncbi:hypothetical protein BOX15_Mlig003263g1 [Macrostomum lignano]|uniref:WD_REPEATS_REGION domain-containing protein n=1 Tax=Macrostomum lignano TaxID=282301 RepID=A0A267EJQ7_9PLAT|nr:hypothetical protein BOX15_Mlig003263g1 [Macrostomum lignano]
MYIRICFIPSLTEEARSQLHGWGSVVAIEASPTTGKQIAVGFSSGTVAVLNSSDCSLHSVAPGAAELRCLSWQTDASAIYTGHSDGSYAVWRADEPAEASRLLKTADNPQTVYGPFPCLPVTHLVHRTAKLGSITVLAGGMAKNTHADRTPSLCFASRSTSAWTCARQLSTWRCCARQAMAILARLAMTSHTLC